LTLLPAVLLSLCLHFGPTSGALREQHSSRRLIVFPKPSQDGGYEWPSVEDFGMRYVFRSEDLGKEPTGQHGGEGDGAQKRGSTVQGNVMDPRQMGRKGGQQGGSSTERQGAAMMGFGVVQVHDTAGSASIEERRQMLQNSQGFEGVHLDRQLRISDMEWLVQLSSDVAVMMSQPEEPRAPAGVSAQATGVLRNNHTPQSDGPVSAQATGVLRNELTPQSDGPVSAQATGVLRNELTPQSDGPVSAQATGVLRNELTPQSDGPVSAQATGVLRNELTPQSWGQEKRDSDIAFKMTGSRPQSDGHVSAQATGVLRNELTPQSDGPVSAQATGVLRNELTPQSWGQEKRDSDIAFKMTGSRPQSDAVQESIQNLMPRGEGAEEQRDSSLAAVNSDGPINLNQGAGAQDKRDSDSAAKSSDEPMNLNQGAGAEEKRDADSAVKASSVELHRHPALRCSMSPGTWTRCMNNREGGSSDEDEQDTSPQVVQSSVGNGQRGPGDDVDFTSPGSGFLDQRDQNMQHSQYDSARDFATPGKDWLKERDSDLQAIDSVQDYTDAGKGASEKLAGDLKAIQSSVDDSAKDFDSPGTGFLTQRDSDLQNSQYDSARDFTTPGKGFLDQRDRDLESSGAEENSALQEISDVVKDPTNQVKGFMVQRDREVARKQSHDVKNSGEDGSPASPSSVSAQDAGIDSPGTGFLTKRDNNLQNSQYDSARDFASPGEGFLDQRDMSIDHQHEVTAQDLQTAEPVQADDPGWKDQWNIRQVRGDYTLGAGATGYGVVVAVIDSGCNPNHPDLKDRLWQNTLEVDGEDGVDDDGNGIVDDKYGANFIDGTGNISDINGHGTHIAGIVAATANNEMAIAGLAPNVTVMCLKFIGDDGTGYESDAMQAIFYATKKKADIQNHSWGNVGTITQGLQRAISMAGAFGQFIVAAAGNYGSDENEPQNKFYPGALSDETMFPNTAPHVMSVAATNQYDQLAYFSNYGDTSVDIAAPGLGIVSLNNDPNENGGMRVLSGTSQAAPHVAAAAAISLSAMLSSRESGSKRGTDQGGNFDSSVLKRILSESSDKIPCLQPLLKSGGRLNAHSAAQLAVTGEVASITEVDNTNPVPTWAYVAFAVVLGIVLLACLSTCIVTSACAAASNTANTKGN